jgi:hypothetical protein
MADIGMWCGPQELTPVQRAVRAGTPETWDIEDGDARISVLVVPLPDAEQAIFHSALLNGSPLVIKARYSSGYYATNLEEVRSLPGIPVWHNDGTHLTFIWLWLFEHDVLRLEKERRSFPPNTIDVTPWRLALIEGIDDTRKRRLALQHKLPFLERDLKSTEETLAEDLESAAKPGPPSEFLEDSIHVLSERRDELTQEIAEARVELGEEEGVPADLAKEQ